MNAGSIKRTETSDIQWVSEKTAAQLTGLSVHTLRGHRLRRKGLPYTKVGRAVRYSITDIASFMQANRIDFS
ncbi:helix-turn-helix domain-containing protein [Nitratidesulfovibrio vulgaris]|uniref:helix-turn-helix domain-containing protein n=1 Tax=Nitratidesulfovibrio vulgaris TaxID=881 RepID=UPI0006746DA2